MEDVFKISKDKTRARELYLMAKERLEEIIPVIPKDKHYKIQFNYAIAILFETISRGCFIAFSKVIKKSYFSA